MVTIVPKEAFDKLNGISEAKDAKKKFDYEDFKKEVIHYSMAKDYLKDKQIEFVGKGSGRTAYMIPVGGCEGHQDRAVCLKIADNVKGIAQNKGEVNTIEKFGKDNACFPKLLGVDKRENISLMTELGRKVEEKEFYEYFAKWCDVSYKFFNKHNYSSEELKDIELRGMNEISTGDDVFFILRSLKRIKRMGNPGKPIVKKVLDDFRKISEKYRKYVSFVSLFEVMFEKEAVYDVALGDFAELDNWAFINRNGEEVLVPIDWGLTEEVKYQYYMK